MFITREELRVLLDVTETAASPSTIDLKRIRRIIRFADTTVGEVMIPLADVVGFNEMRDMEEATRRVIKHGYNRLPVFSGNITNVKGVLTLNTWDLMQSDLKEQLVSNYVSQALYLSKADAGSSITATAGQERPYGNSCG